MKWSLAVFIMLFSLGIKGQVWDSTYWKGWYQTPVDVVDLSRWEQKDWWIASGVLAGGALLYTQDEAIRDEFQSFRNPTTNAIAKYGLEPFGSGVYSMSGTALAYGVGYLTKDEKLKRTSAQAVKAYLLAAGAGFIVKQITHRSRPYEADRSDLWHGPYGLTSANDGFPSGHTAAAFAVASVYAHSYKEKPWLGVAMYSVAGLTGLSRINDNRHWASDVFFGAALGYYVGRTIVKTDSQLQLFPSGNGIYLSWRFK